MKKIIIHLLLPIFFSLYPETKIETLYSQCKQNSNFSLKKAIQLHAKPAIAGTAMGAGIHLLYDAFITTVDVKSTSQRNTQKGINVNALLGTGFVIAGVWFFKHIWENEAEEKDFETSLPKN